MKSRKIPNTDSISVLARFWDTHDASEFSDQLEEVESAFEQRPKPLIATSRVADEHPFSSDRPITSANQDLLGRSNFADYLSAAIRSWRGKESLVIALYGPWGIGKSSVKNMVLESLKKSPKDGPAIVEFNPWQWAGQEQLVEAFFQEIGVVLGRSDTSKIGKQRAAKWRSYGAYVSLGAKLAQSSKLILPFLGIPSVASDLLSTALQESADVMQEGHEALTAMGDARERSLVDLKTDLFDALKTMKRPLLVVMDDVDRLSTEEIKLLFQLVKANADFPNLIYLLLFQRDIVEKSLDAIAPISGREFLEKIVQVGFDIPLIERRKLEKILFTGLDEILSHGSVEQRFESQRWQNLFISGLRGYFENLRDVRRYLAMLGFHVPIFKQNGSFNVNPVDLIGLESLRVFEPNVYEALPEHKAGLLGLSRGLSDNWGDELRNFLSSLLDGLPKNRQNRVREILSELFPQVEWALKNYGYGSNFEDGWFRDLRICHKDIFDRYFHFAIPEGDISQAQLDLILSASDDRNHLVAQFKTLKERGLLEVALDRLEAYKQQISLEHAVSFIAAIFDIGDDLDRARRGFFEIQPDMHAVRIVHWYLKQERDAAKRAAILSESMRLTSGLYLPVMQISIELHERSVTPDESLLPDDSREDFKNICLQKINEAVRDRKLEAHPRLLYILYRWKEWTVSDEPLKWVQQLISSDEGLISFLNSLVEEGVTSGRDGERVYQFMRLKSIEDFVPLMEIETRVRQLDRSKLGDNPKAAIAAFERALKRRGQGRHDDDWSSDTDRR
jgi:predicted KAP-like P-loop ATPase